MTMPQEGNDPTAGTPDGGAPAPEGGATPPAPVVTDPASIAPQAPAPEADEPTAAFTPEQLPYVEKLRKENAARRTEAGAWKEAFAAFDSVDQSWIQETFRLAASQDPAVAAAGVQRIDQMKAILLGGEAGSTPAAPPAAPDPATPPTGEPVTNPDDAPLTQAQFKQWQAEAEERARVSSQKQLIDDRLSALGIQKFAEGGQVLTPEYRMALAFARDDTQGDLDEAVAMVGRYQQAIRDGAIGAKQEQSSKFPTSPGNAASGSPADPATQDAPSWDTARAQLDAMLDAEPGEVTG